MLLIGPVENLRKSRGIGGKKPRKNEKKKCKNGENEKKPLKKNFCQMLGLDFFWWLFKGTLNLCHLC